MQNTLNLLLYYVNHDTYDGEVNVLLILYHRYNKFQGHAS